MITPWVVNTFTRMWDEVQQRIARHRIPGAGNGDDRADPENPPPRELDREFGPPPY